MASTAEVHQISDESAMEMGEVGTNAANGGKMADDPAGPYGSDQADQDPDQREYPRADVTLLEGELARAMLSLANIKCGDGYAWDEIFLRFEGLERAHIRHLQEKILGLAQGDTPVNMKELGEMLHQYSAALRDLEYMRNLEDFDLTRLIDAKDVDSAKPLELLNELWPSSISAKQFQRGLQKPKDPLRSFLNGILPARLVFTGKEADYRSAIEHTFRRRIQRDSPFADKLARFIVAFVGGLSLVLPMIIMRIHQDTNKSLITTSVAVLLFSATVSVLFKASNSETLGITAAYAAVLVVFVGTST